jgi:hypothetical protein
MENEAVSKTSSAESFLY